MSDIKLKPCPYCNGKADKWIEDACVYYVCTYCNLRGPDFFVEKANSEEQAAAAWNALPRHLRWTTDTPTEPGWYFVRYKGKVTICRADYPKGSPYMTYRVVGSPGAWMMDEHSDEWAGPIPEPQEQP